MRPTAFIGSSSESVDVAKAIQYNLDSRVECVLWNQKVFNLSRLVLDDLLEVLNVCDFGIFVFAPDDTIRFRGVEMNSARDNVVLELGLFTGRLGRERCFLVMPENHGDFHLPSDLLGLTVATYHYQPDNLPAALGRACTQIEDAVRRVGPVNLLHFNEERAARTVRDARARTHLTSISKLHNRITNETEFDTDGKLLIKAFVEYPMTRYAKALSEFRDRREMFLRSEPRMQVAMEAIACSCEKVRAISIVGEDPWHHAGEDNPFIRVNIESAKKVEIQRIYIVENETDLERLRPIINRKRAAGIKVRYGFKRDLRHKFEQTFDLMNVLICDRMIMSYSLAETDHDGRLVSDEHEISKYITRFDFIWGACAEFED